MARRSSRSLVALLIALALASCAPAAGGNLPTTPAPVLTTSSTTTSTSTTTTLPTTTTSFPATTTTTETLVVEGRTAVPWGEGPFPSVVLVHGGGWVTGDPETMDPLADHLNENGYLTVNTSYTLATFDHPGYPDAISDVACAVSYAASHPESDGTVTLIGHSAGAHIGAVVALNGDDYGDDCQFPGSGVPDRFVGLAGPYDVLRLGLFMVPFFGGGPEQLPDAWEAGNPLLLTDENTELESLIVYGDRDRAVAESFATVFHETLTTSGSGSVLELVEGAGHADLYDPEVVGDLIVTWLER